LVTYKPVKFRKVLLGEWSLTPVFAQVILGDRLSDAQEMNANFGAFHRNCTALPISFEGR
jgi:hypothetical protein